MTRDQLILKWQHKWEPFLRGTARDFMAGLPVKKFCHPDDLETYLPLDVRRYVAYQYNKLMELLFDRAAREANKAYVRKSENVDSSLLDIKSRKDLSTVDLPEFKIE